MNARTVSPVVSDDSEAEQECRDEVVVKSSSCHSSKLLLSLFNLKCNGDFCDITIKSGDFEMKAHRTILASATQYFKAMFLNETKEAETGIVDFSKMSADVLEQCIMFIYSGEVKISMKIVRELLDAGEMMQLSELTALCVEFLAERINMQSCTEVITLSALYNKASLNGSIEEFLSSHFDEYKETKAFISLGFESLKHCLELLDDGCSSGEIRKWNGILAWVNHDSENRGVHFPELFGLIQLSDLPKGFLKDNILSNLFVKTSNDCLNKLVLLTVDESLPEPPNRRKMLKRFFSISSTSQVIVQYNMKSGNWLPVAKLPGYFSKYMDAISYRGCIFAGNGVDLYRFCDGKWSESLTASFKNYARRLCECKLCKFYATHDCCKVTNCYNRCIGVGGKVYMLTSSCIYEYNISESSVLRFDINIGLGEGFFITASYEKIYAMGGSGSASKAFEIDLVSKKCSHISDMQIPRCDGFSACFDGKIYTFPGSVGYQGTGVECYISEIDQWITVPDTNLKQNIRGVYIGDKLYIIGGQKQDALQTIDLKKLTVSMPKYNGRMVKCFTDSF